MKTGIAAILALTGLAQPVFAQTTPVEVFEEYARTCATERAKMVPLMYESSGRKMPADGRLSPEDQRQAERLTDMTFWNLLTSTRDNVKLSFHDQHIHNWDPAQICAHRVRLNQLARGATQWPYPTAHKAVDDAQSAFYADVK